MGERDKLQQEQIDHLHNELNELRKLVNSLHPLEDIKHSIDKINCSIKDTNNIIENNMSVSIKQTGSEINAELLEKILRVSSSHFRVNRDLQLIQKSFKKLLKPVQTSAG